MSKSKSQESDPSWPFEQENSASIMLSVHWNGAETRMLLPYIALTEVLRVGRQAILVFGDIEVTLLFMDGERSWSADTLLDTLQEHRVRRIFDDPQNGLGLDVVRVRQDDDGQKREPVQMPESD